jgi:hypothetical protein
MNPVTQSQKLCLVKPSMAQSWQTTNHQKSRFLANTFECVVEKTRHAGLETCDTAGWEACATWVGEGFAGFTMKYPG